MKINSLNINSLKDFAGRLAVQLQLGDVVTLTGDLGSGKTTFAGLLLGHLSVQDIAVTSPTFNIVNVYDADSFPVWHFDLYRLEDENEIANIGIDEALTSALSIIEWPEIANSYLPAQRIEINISFATPNTRNLQITNTITRIIL
ncbi:MAG: tRNA (adenosine(37)-N6)-threonylcarbamoyltransferase complex ATPase subunit type 1 TsaE [Rickettsiales bacterium]